MTVEIQGDATADGYRLVYGEIPHQVQAVFVLSEIHCSIEVCEVDPADRGDDIVHRSCIGHEPILHDVSRGKVFTYVLVGTVDEATSCDHDLPASVPYGVGSRFGLEGECSLLYGHRASARLDEARCPLQGSAGDHCIATLVSDDRCGTVSNEVSPVDVEDPFVVEYPVNTSSPSDVHSSDRPISSSSLEGQASVISEDVPIVSIGCSHGMPVQDDDDLLALDDRRLFANRDDDVIQ